MSAWATAGRAFVRAIDFALVRHYGIFVFSDDPNCVLRLSPARASQTIVLHDGTRVSPEDPLLDIHLWNDHLPLLGATGATPAWGIRFTRRLRRSLLLLAEYIDCTPRFDTIQAFHAEIGFLEAREFPQLRRLVESLGFEFQPGAPPRLRFWRYAFWANLYSWALMWTFNPGSLRGKHLSQMARSELWLSRAILLEKYHGERDRTPQISGQ